MFPKKSITLSLVCLMAMLPGCSKVSGADSCVAFSPVYISKQDILTDGTARQILAINETGKSLCGWKPSTPAKRPL